MITAFMETRMESLQETVKAWVSDTLDAPEGGAWRNGWEFYAYMLWLGDTFHTGMIERDILDPAVNDSASALGEVELTALLSWAWDEYAEEHEVGERRPWTMDVPSRRKALASVLTRHMQAAAQSDGAEVEERSFRESWGEEDEGGCEGQDA